MTELRIVVPQATCFVSKSFFCSLHWKVFVRSLLLLPLCFFVIPIAHEMLVDVGKKLGYEQLMYYYVNDHIRTLMYL